MDDLIQQLQRAILVLYGPAHQHVSTLDRVKHDAHQHLLKFAEQKTADSWQASIVLFTNSWRDCCVWLQQLAQQQQQTAIQLSSDQQNQLLILAFSSQILQSKVKDQWAVISSAPAEFLENLRRLLVSHLLALYQASRQLSGAQAAVRQNLQFAKNRMCMALALFSVYSIATMHRNASEQLLSLAQLLQTAWSNPADSTASMQQPPLDLVIEYLTFVYEHLKLFSADDTSSALSGSSDASDRELQLAAFAGISSAQLLHMLQQFQHIELDVLSLLIPALRRSQNALNVRLSALKCLKAVVDFGVPLQLIYADTQLLSTVFAECLTVPSQNGISSDDASIAMEALQLLEMAFSIHFQTKFQDRILQAIGSLLQYGEILVTTIATSQLLAVGSICRQILNVLLQVLIVLGSKHALMIVQGRDAVCLRLLQFVQQQALKSRYLCAESLDLWSAIESTISTEDRVFFTPLFEEILKSCVTLCRNDFCECEGSDEDDTDDFREFIAHDLFVMCYAVSYDRYFDICHQLILNSLQSIQEQQQGQQPAAVEHLESLLFALCAIGDSVSYRNHYNPEKSSQDAYPFIERIIMVITRIDSLLLQAGQLPPSSALRVRLEQRCAQVLGRYATFLSHDVIRLSCSNQGIQSMSQIIMGTFNFVLTRLCGALQQPTATAQVVDACVMSAYAFHSLCDHMFPQCIPAIISSDGNSHPFSAEQTAALVQAATAILRLFVQTSVPINASLDHHLLVSLQQKRTNSNFSRDSIDKVIKELYSGISGLVDFLLGTDGNATACTELVQQIMQPIAAAVSPHLSQQQLPEEHGLSLHKLHVELSKCAFVLSELELSATSPSPLRPAASHALVISLIQSLWTSIVEKCFAAIVLRTSPHSLDIAERAFESACAVVMQMVRCARARDDVSAVSISFLRTICSCIYSVYTLNQPHVSLWFGNHVFAVLRDLLLRTTSLRTLPPELHQEILDGHQKAMVRTLHLCHQGGGMAALRTELVDALAEYLSSILKTNRLDFFFIIEPQASLEQGTAFLEQLLDGLTSCLDSPQTSTSEKTVSFVEQLLQLSTTLADSNQWQHFHEIYKEIVQALSLKLVNLVWRSVLLEHSHNTHILLRIILSFATLPQCRLGDGYVALNRLLQVHTLNSLLGAAFNAVVKVEKQRFVASIAQCRTMQHLRSAVARFKAKIAESNAVNSNESEEQQSPQS